LAPFNSTGNRLIHIRLGGVALEQIGQKLKAARESQGLSLAQINERTKIPINHLQAIDAGVTDDLPETVYVAGFIKRYADCVGLNGPSLSDEYRRLASEDNGGNGDGAWGANRGQKAAQTMVSPAYVQRVRTEQRQPSFLRNIVFPAMWIVALIPILTFLFQWQQNNSNNAQDTTLPNFQNINNKFNQVQPSATPNIPTQASPTTATATTPPASTEAQVSISASRHVWVEISAVSSGESLFTGFLEAGDQRDFKDPQGIRVHAGNGGNLTVMQDGKSQTLGAAGKITEKAFMAKNANPNAIATTADGKPVTTATTATKPVTVKKVVKKTATADASAVPKRRYRSLDDGPSRLLNGESVGGTRSIDVPYRYTEGQ
jgi:cytoskeletal protein RodZ